MKLIKTVNEIRSIVKDSKKRGLTVGLVPTMGYLHEGHMSLMNESVKNNDITIVSIFLNPMQFGPKEDLSTYPKDLDRDMKVCSDAKVDYIFNPEVSEMYDSTFTTFVDTTGVTENLCGKSRPTHFRGVCTVVSKLFNIVNPDNAYFGQKDAQQLAVIKRFVKDLNFDINIVGCPIVREKDGLAKSSRNTYLSDTERQAALILSKSLELGKELIKSGERDSSKIIETITNNINKELLAKIDYVNVVDALSCEDIDVIKDEILVAIAVYIGKTRLIDNFMMEV